MAIDLFELRAYTEGIDVDELRLVHLTKAGGGPGWGLMRSEGSHLGHWLSLGAQGKDEAVQIIEAVGLMPLSEEHTQRADHDVIVLLQPGSDEGPNEPPV